MLELHKAVSAAESKANEMVISERAKMDRAISEARKQTREELLGTFNHQEESSEVSRNWLQSQKVVKHRHLSLGFSIFDEKS